MPGEVIQSQTQASPQQAPGPAPQPLEVASGSGAGVQQLRFALVGGRPISYVSNLLLSYPHERDDMMRLLQQTVGNAYVQELLETTPEFKGATGEPLTVDAYWNKYARQTLLLVQQRLMTDVQFDISHTVGHRGGSRHEREQSDRNLGRRYRGRRLHFTSHAVRASNDTPH